MLSVEYLLQRARSSCCPLRTSHGPKEAESRPDVHDMRRRWWHRCKLHSPNFSNTAFYTTLQDLAVYKILGSLERLEIAEVCARSGSTCGSIFLDLRFRELIEGLLERHPRHLNPLSLAAFMDAFSETDKLAFRGEADDENMFHFTCFETDDTCASYTLDRIYDSSHFYVKMTHTSDSLTASSSSLGTSYVVECLTLSFTRLQISTPHFNVPLITRPYM